MNGSGIYAGLLVMCTGEVLALNVSIYDFEIINTNKGIDGGGVFGWIKSGVTTIKDCNISGKLRLHNS